MREHGTKTTPVFLPADGEASWSLLPSSVSLLSGGTVQPENTYSCILKVTGQVWESQKKGQASLVNNMANKDEKTKTYCVICSFDNMLVIAEKFW